jgi:hypothetical protein
VRVEVDALARAPLGKNAAAGADALPRGYSVLFDV